jgi:hypothetical protein
MENERKMEEVVRGRGRGRGSGSGRKTWGLE